VDVRAYGAVGDGSTDNTTAIQAAIDASKVDGGIVFFPPGIYDISAPLVVPSHTRIVGVGMGGATQGIFTDSTLAASIIRNTGTGIAVRFVDETTSTDKIVIQSSISDMGIVGNTLSSHGITIQNPAIVEITRCFIANHGGIGVDVKAGEFSSTWGQNFYLRNSWLTHNIIGGVRLGGSYRPTVNVIEGNSILASDKYLIFVQNAWATNIIHNELASLNYLTPLVAGGRPHGIVIDAATIVNIEGNSFESMSGLVGTPIKHIYTGFEGDTQVTTTTKVQGVRIVGNSFNPGVPDNDLIHARGVRGLTIEENFFQDGVAGGTNRAIVLEDQEAPWPVPDLHKNYFFSTNEITPLTIIDPYTTARLSTPTYGTSVPISINDDSQSAGTVNQFKITVTNGTAFTISNPSGFGYNDEITIIVANGSGGAMGIITWDTLYKLATWTNPADVNQRAIRYRFDPNGSWYEVGRSSGDVPT